jgi:hypothetical protein
MALSLIVKGDKFQAARAAADRGIYFCFVREVRHEGTVETVGLSGSEQRDKIVRWFGEGTMQAPFPVGTLLLFTELDDEPARKEPPRDLYGEPMPNRIKW